MNNSVEQLKLEVDVIKKLLNDLKNNVSFSEIEKKNKAEAIRKEAEATKQKIQDTIKALENKTDDTSKMEKEKAITLLASFDDITILYNSIINPSSTNSATNSPTNPSTINTGTEIQNQPPTENKNVFSRVTQWVKDQVSSVFDKEKWSSEGGKNVLRTAGLFGALTFAYKGIKAGIKKLFGKDKDEEDDEYYESEEKESKKKKKKEEDEKDKEKEDKNKEEKKKEEDKEGFRNKWYGKALKWLGIAGAAGGGIFSLSKWLHKGVDDDSKETPKEGDKENTSESSSTKKESEDTTTKKDSEESSKSNESEQSKEGVDKSKNTYTNSKGKTFCMYDQNDPRRGNKRKNGGTTMNQTGCLLTSAAVIHSMIDSSITPDYYRQNYAGIHPYDSIPKASKHKIESKKLTIGSNTIAEMKDNLRKGNPVNFMVRGPKRGGKNTCTTSQHYMTAVDIREKDGKDEVFIANTHNGKGGGRIPADKAFVSLKEASLYTLT